MSPRTLSLCSYIFLVLMDHGVYFVYIEFRPCARGCGVASFITTDEPLESNRDYCFPMQAVLPEGFPFHQFNLLEIFFKYSKMIISH